MCLAAHNVLCRTLSGLGLQGSIAPMSLSQLGWLVALDLSMNSLTGNDDS